MADLKAALARPAPHRKLGAFAFTHEGWGGREPVGLTERFSPTRSTAGIEPGAMTAWRHRPISIGVEVLDAVDVAFRRVVVLSRHWHPRRLFLAGFQAARAPRRRLQSTAPWPVAAFPAWDPERETHLVLGERYRKGGRHTPIVLTVATVACSRCRAASRRACAAWDEGRSGGEAAAGGRSPRTQSGPGDEGRPPEGRRARDARRSR